jgi:hypothetical protein
MIGQDGQEDSGNQETHPVNPADPVRLRLVRDAGFEPATSCV